MTRYPKNQSITVAHHVFVRIERCSRFAAVLEDNGAWNVIQIFKY